MNGLVRPFLLLGGSIRGICVMGAGMLTYFSCKNVLISEDNKSTLIVSSTEFSSAIEVVCMVAFVWTLRVCTQHPSIDLFMIVIMCILIYVSNVDNWINRWGKIKPLQWLGKWSAVAIMMVASKYVPKVIIIAIKKIIKH